MQAQLPLELWHKIAGYLIHVDDSLDDLRNLCSAFGCGDVKQLCAEYAREQVDKWVERVRAVKGQWPNPYVGWKFPIGVTLKVWQRRLLDVSRCVKCLGEDKQLGWGFIPNAWKPLLPRWAVRLCRRCFIYRCAFEFHPPSQKRNNDLIP